ncbi:MAG TPA: FkbM family methyltransferase [Acidimicrobiales bacterium]|nr:FkbM family methyltransferase [Acidimicrobiales bacterium]
MASPLHESRDEAPTSSRLTLTDLARKVAEKGAAGVLEAGSRRTRRRLSRAIAAAVGTLPVDVLVAVMDETAPVVRLDYERAEILLSVGSQVDLFRATSCRKEPETIRWIEKYVTAGDVFYDVGANVGAYALVAAAQAPGRVTCHAFEPSFATYHQLCKNVLLNRVHDVVFPHLIALSDRNGTSVLNYHSVVAGTALHTVGATVDFKGNEFEPAYRQRMLTFALDELVFGWGFDMPNHLKLDVDGTELDVLLGARRVLADDRLRSLLVEVSHHRGRTDAIRDILAQSGLELESEALPAPGVSNYLFVRGRR